MRNRTHFENFCDDMSDFRADFRIIFDAVSDEMFDIENAGLENNNARVSIETQRLGKETIEKLERKVSEIKRYLER